MIVVSDAALAARGSQGAGLSISSPIERRREEEWAPLLQEAARRISERMAEAGIGKPAA